MQGEACTKLMPAKLRAVLLPVDSAQCQATQDFCKFFEKSTCGVQFLRDIDFSKKSLSLRRVSLCGVTYFANISAKKENNFFWPVNQGPRWVPFMKKHAKKSCDTYTLNPFGWYVLGQKMHFSLQKMQLNPFYLEYLISIGNLCKSLAHHIRF